MCRDAVTRKPSLRQQIIHKMDGLSALSRIQKTLLIMITDYFLIILALLVSKLLKYEILSFLWTNDFWIGSIFVATLTIVALYCMGTYRAIVRFVTGKILKPVLISSCLSGFFVLLTQLHNQTTLQLSIPILHTIIVFLFIGGSRFLARQLFRQGDNQHKKPVIIFGAGSAGLQLINSLFHGREYQPVALVDDNPQIQSLNISGLRVQPSSALKALQSTTNAEFLFLAKPNMTPERRRKLLLELDGSSLVLKRVPSMAEIFSGEAGIDDLIPVTPEDLLGRDPVPPVKSLMSARVTNKTILISGAGGSIGSELCRQIAKYSPKEIILVDSSEFALYEITTELADLRDKLSLDISLVSKLGTISEKEFLNSIFNSSEIHTVFHAAAYKHVPLVESNIFSGVKNNIFGTKNIADISARHGVNSFTLVSTDKAVRPTNVMGATKRIAELIIQGKATEEVGTVFSIVRFGNVLGSSGSVIPRFKSQIKSGGPITVTHENITRYFMTIPEAAELVIQSAGMATGGEVFLLDMGDPVKIIDVAMNMARLYGYTPSLEGNPMRNPSIEIVLTGLRPGEKLYEELLINAESEETAHPKIFKARESWLEQEELTKRLADLDHATRTLDTKSVRTILAAVVEGYTTPDA